MTDLDTKALCPKSTKGRNNSSDDSLFPAPSNLTTFLLQPPFLHNSAYYLRQNKIMNSDPPHPQLSPSVKLLNQQIKLKASCNHRLNVTSFRIFLMVPISTEVETLSNEGNSATMTQLFPNLISPTRPSAGSPRVDQLYRDCTPGNVSGKFMTLSFLSLSV